MHNFWTYLVHMQALLTSSRVAARLGVSRGTVLNMAKDGRLQPVGRAAGPLGAFLFDSEAIDALAAEASPEEAAR